MVSRPAPRKVLRAQTEIGAQIRAWRTLQGLTAQQLAERVGVQRQTIARLEAGDVGVSLVVLLGAANALGQLDAVVTSLDPYESDLGRARADQVLPKRVRR